MTPGQTRRMQAQSSRKAITISAWVLQILAAAAFFGAGTAKLTGDPQMVAVFEKVGVGQWFRFVTGVLEIAGAIGLLIPRTAIYAAGLLACVMVGAIIAHLTILGGSPAAPLMLLVVVLAIGWLRKPATR